MRSYTCFPDNFNYAHICIRAAYMNNSTTLETSHPIFSYIFIIKYRLMQSGNFLYFVFCCTFLRQMGPKLNHTVYCWFVSYYRDKLCNGREGMSRSNSRYTVEKFHKFRLQWDLRCCPLYFLCAVVQVLEYLRLKIIFLYPCLLLVGQFL